MITFAYKRSRFTGLSRVLAPVLVALTMISGCGNRNDAIQEVGAQQLYEDGAELLRKNNYNGAIVSFQNLGLRYPFSPAVRQAQLDLIYALYRSRQTEAAIDIAENFMRENPRLPEVAYCLYMTGLIYFDEEPNVLERVFRVDISERPPKETYLGFAAFQDLVRQFPDSEYVEDARQRMVYLRNRLATYENHVARYYIRRGAYVAAINRGKYALEHYPGAPELEQTLTLMVQSYRALGMTDLAEDTSRVLRENFGESDEEESEGA
jgi:outer membrane protein assembly factor BamD